MRAARLHGVLRVHAALTLALQAAAEEHYEEVRELLHASPPLRPLLAVLAWDAARSAEAKGRMLAALTAEEGEDEEAGAEADAEREVCCARSLGAELRFRLHFAHEVAAAAREAAAAARGGGEEAAAAAAVVDAESVTAALASRSPVAVLAAHLCWLPPATATRLVAGEWDGRLSAACSARPDSATALAAPPSAAVVCRAWDVELLHVLFAVAAAARLVAALAADSAADDSAQVSHPTSQSIRSTCCIVWWPPRCGCCVPGSRSWRDLLRDEVIELSCFVQTEVLDVHLAAVRTPLRRAWVLRAALAVFRQRLAPDSVDGGAAAAAEVDARRSGGGGADGGGTPVPTLARARRFVDTLHRAATALLQAEDQEASGGRTVEAAVLHAHREALVVSTTQVLWHLQLLRRLAEPVASGGGGGGSSGGGGGGSGEAGGADDMRWATIGTHVCATPSR